MIDIRISDTFDKIDIERLLDFEKFNNVELPEDYRNFLLTYNGGVLRSNTIPLEFTNTDVLVLFGMFDLPQYGSFFNKVDVFCERIPSWYIPIASDSGGNLFIMSLWEGNKGVVAFWRHEEESPEGEADQYFDNLTKVGESFMDFLSKINYR